MIHLPDQTMVYDINASQTVGEPIWYTMTSTVDGKGLYRAHNHVYAYNRWNVADPSTNKIGYLTDEISSHYGDVIGWEFSTQMLYNDSRGAIFNELELIATTGRTQLGLSPIVSTCYSLDGVTWSQEQTINAGKTGERTKRLVWFRQGHMRNWRIQKFKGTSDAMISITALEAQVEPLSV